MLEATAICILQNKLTFSQEWGPSMGCLRRLSLPGSTKQCHNSKKKASDQFVSSILTDCHPRWSYRRLSPWGSRRDTVSHKFAEKGYIQFVCQIKLISVWFGGNVGTGFGYGADKKGQISKSKKRWIFTSVKVSVVSVRYFVSSYSGTPRTHSSPGNCSQRNGGRIWKRVVSGVVIFTFGFTFPFTQRALSPPSPLRLLLHCVCCYRKQRYEAVSTTKLCR